jgi:prenyl protein peptidase
MLLVGILFAGPLFEAGIVDGSLKDWLSCRYIVPEFSSWVGYRNLVVVR